MLLKHETFRYVNVWRIQCLMHMYTGKFVQLPYSYHTDTTPKSAVCTKDVFCCCLRTHHNVWLYNVWISTIIITDMTIPDQHFIRALYNQYPLVESQRDKWVWYSLHFSHLAIINNQIVYKTKIQFSLWEFLVGCGIIYFWSYPKGLATMFCRPITMLLVRPTLDEWNSTYLTNYYKTTM